MRKKQKLFAGLLAMLFAFMFATSTVSAGGGDTTQVNIYKVKATASPIEEKPHDGSKIDDLKGYFGTDELIPNVKFKYAKLTDDELAAIMTADMVLDPAISSIDQVTHASAVEEVVTGATGVVTFDLNDGHYVFFEETPATVSDSAASKFVLSLPFETSPGVRAADVHIYPKNFMQEAVAPVKTIRDENLQVGEVAQYDIEVAIPAGIETYTVFGIYDQLAPGMFDETKLTVEVLNQATSTTLPETYYEVVKGVKPSPTEVPLQGSNANMKDQEGVFIKFTAAGLKALKDENIANITITLSAPVIGGTDTADGAVANKVFLVWSNPQDPTPDYPESGDPTFKNGRVEFKKVNVKKDGLAGVIFQLDGTTFMAEEGDGKTTLTEAEQVELFVKANLAWAAKAGQPNSSLVLSDGTPITEANIPATWAELHVKSDANGRFSLYGLALDKTYKMTEVVAPDGYQLITEAVEFTAKEHSDPENATAFGEEAANRLEIVNFKHYSPSTGDVGMGIVGGFGAALLLAAVFFLRKRQTATNI